MAILRNKNREQYVTITIKTIRDNNLRNKDIGMLVRLLSLPDNWNFSVQGLIKAKITRDGKSAINESLKTLEKNGYLVRKQMYDEQRRFRGYEWEVFEQAQNRETYPIAEKPSTELPQTGYPSAEKQTQSNNDIPKNNISINEQVCTLTPDDYALLCGKYGKDVIDSMVVRIIANHYRGCMNIETISQWCDERVKRQKRKNNKNGFCAFEQREYNFEEIEKKLLAQK